MRILITGAAGFVGLRLAPLLARSGHEVLALVHSDGSAAAARPLLHPGISIRVIDLRRPDFSTLPAGMDAVIALAQSQQFRRFPEGARDIYEVNVAAHFELLDWAHKHGIQRFVYASSGGIYGPCAELNVQETQPLSVDSRLGFYLGSKLSAEVLLQSYWSFFRSAVILRPFFIYGPGQRRDMLVPRLIESVRSAVPIRLQGADGLKLNPIFVDDAAAAFAAALSVTGCHVINVAGPQVVSLRELGLRIGEALGQTPSFEVVDEAPSDYVADTSVANALLGRAAIRVDEGLRRIVKGEAKNEQHR